MNNDNKFETEMAGLNCWASYATVPNYKKKQYYKWPPLLLERTQRT